MLGFEMTEIAPWAELGAVGCLIVTVLWMVTKGFPQLVERFTAETTAQRAEFREELKLHREDLREHRVQSRELAESGHEAVKRLSESMDDLRDELKRGLER